MNRKRESIACRSRIKSTSEPPNLPKRSKLDFHGLISQIQEPNQTELKQCKSKLSSKEDNSKKKIVLESSDLCKDQEVSLEPISSPDPVEKEIEEGEIESGKIFVKKFKRILFL